jgi:hypothetical protein
VLAVTHLLLFVLRVLPGEIREWLEAERNLPGKRGDAGEEVGRLRGVEADASETRNGTY